MKHVFHANLVGSSGRTISALPIVAVVAWIIFSLAPLLSIGGAS